MNNAMGQRVDATLGAGSPLVGENRPEARQWQAWAGGLGQCAVLHAGAVSITTVHNDEPPDTGVEIGSLDLLGDYRRLPSRFRPHHLENLPK